jgi:hypothetical protein
VKYAFSLKPNAPAKGIWEGFDVRVMVLPASLNVLAVKFDFQCY